MSRDRLAQMKLERERQRGVAGSAPQAGGYQEQQGYGAPPQQQQAGQQQQYGGYEQGYGQQQQSPPMQQQPTMYPAAGGGGQQQQGYAQAPQGQFAAPAAPPPAVQQGQYGAANGGRGQQGYEMGGMNGGAAAVPVGPGNSMQDFFAEIETISQSLSTLKGNINQINGLHNTVLNSSTNEERQQQAEADLKGLTAETSRLTNNIKLRIKNLSELNDRIPNVPGNEGEKNTRRMQVAVQKKKFMDLIQEYREVEAKSREKYRARMERQIKIVKPDATQEEIKYAVENDQGSQVFAQALTQSTRYADARNAYREVQERHEDIKRIAQTMTELQELFNDMAMLVERQDEQIQTIEASAMDVENNMGAAHTEIEKGKVSARKARKKRIFCFWLLVIIIIAAALAITLGILSKNGTI